MVVVVGDITIGEDADSAATYDRLKEWTVRAFPTNTGLPGSEAIRLPHHSTMLYYGRGVPDEKFLAAIAPVHIERFDFTGVVWRMKAVGGDSRGLVIMIFKCEGMQLVANRLHSGLTRDMEKPPKQGLHEDDQEYQHGFCPHITLAAFENLQAAADALKTMEVTCWREWIGLFYGKDVRMHDYKAIE